MTAEIETAASIINLYENLKIRGLMIIPPQVKDIKEYTGFFEKAKKLQEKIEKRVKPCKNLSMGMSNDYETAVKSGATHIRIGTSLFGDRRK